MDQQNEIMGELLAALQNLLEQVYQMQGMFDDEDGTIRNAVEDAEEAEERALAYRSSLRD
jgi:hypothetical protein